MWRHDSQGRGRGEGKPTRGCSKGEIGGGGGEEREEAVPGEKKGEEKTHFTR